jgi:hypothetical protein
MRSFHVAVLASALAAAGCGKGARGDCPQLDICGGSPVGTWQVSAGCQVPAVRPSQPIDVNEFAMTMGMPFPPTIAPPQPNAVVSSQTTSGDWCSSLVINFDGSVSNANLWHDAPDLSGGKMIFVDDQGARSYITKLEFTIPKGQDVTHFARRCLVANGAQAPTCAKLATALTTFYTPAQASVPPTFTDITCAAASDGGCDCTYGFTVVVDDQGTWGIDDNDPTVLLQDSQVLTFNGQQVNSQSSSSTLRSAFCATPGQRLQLSGLRGGSLSDVQGLRTIALSPM